ncbi:hypothetical protein ACFQY4_44725 [Catellatospora bangladeshensis]|uniref:Uncharacterized protein n=1 Tax=Catellatospora bangladeshensis TaxID=310355 RepID=A0A8J3JRL3_9ACTN|nr:hypothetical protein [Catellatospora bangladeshensis]GIF83643.1 hypothetical protein Cba03nite_49920 [Catellatospora bangladeshensis]
MTMSEVPDGDAVGPLPAPAGDTGDQDAGRRPHTFWFRLLGLTPDSPDDELVEDLGGMLKGYYVIAAALSCFFGDRLLGGMPSSDDQAAYDAWMNAHWPAMLAIVVLLPQVPLAAGLAVRWLYLLVKWGYGRWSERARHRRERAAARQLLLTERVNALHRKVGDTRQTLRGMARETEQVAEELETYLQRRLAFLDELTTEVQQREQLAQLTAAQTAAFDQALKRQFGRERRSGFWHQVGFALLAFLLGFLTNWLSDPLLAVIKAWYSR